MSDPLTVMPPRPSSESRGRKIHDQVRRRLRVQVGDVGRADLETSRREVVDGGGEVQRSVSTVTVVTPMSARSQRASEVGEAENQIILASGGRPAIVRVIVVEVHNGVAAP